MYVHMDSNLIVNNYLFCTEFKLNKLHLHTYEYICCVVCIVGL